MFVTEESLSRLLCLSVCRGQLGGGIGYRQCPL